MHLEIYIFIASTLNIDAMADHSDLRKQSPMSTDCD
jgi:hypothetical protein